ncbi:Tetratricopeptide repeat protein [Crateriforma conspicua]|nr:Tetratricopeptide repeat protein [Crateriforma conspicua]
MVFAGFLGSSWFLTRDQQGQRLMKDKKYSVAAETFDDPMRSGVAWYRAGEFEKAVQAFARVRSPESAYNRGNAWMLLGKYDKAIASYQEAIEQRPDWKEANDNLNIAEARLKMTDAPGGDMGDQRLGADKIVFDKKKSNDGQDTEVAGSRATTDANVQAIWLRQVQTQPADFLKSKFAYQQALRSEEPSP